MLPLNERYIIIKKIDWQTDLFLTAYHLFVGYLKLKKILYYISLFTVPSVLKQFSI